MTEIFALMLRPASFLAFSLLAGAGLLATPALAAPLRDAASGLAVNPPPGYAAKPEQPGQHNVARFSIQRPGEQETGCQVGFTPAAKNASLSQAQINAVISQPHWQEAARAALGPIYDITTSGTADYGPLRVLVMVADIKPRPQLPPRAARIRTYFTIMETPRGRTSMVCVADKADFDTRLPEFEMTARGITAP
jgi:hypothetical protein